jgi:hypothetical protein
VSHKKFRWYNSSSRELLVPGYFAPPKNLTLVFSFSCFPLRCLTSALPTAYVLPARFSLACQTLLPACLLDCHDMCGPDRFSFFLSHSHITGDNNATTAARQQQTSLSQSIVVTPTLRRSGLPVCSLQASSARLDMDTVGLRVYQLFTPGAFNIQ